MKARVDAKVEDLREIVGRYGAFDVAVPFFGAVTMYVPPWEASVKLGIAYQPGAPETDPWELRAWQMARVKQCVADLADAGWYLFERLDIDFSASVHGGAFTLNGDLHVDPGQFRVDCTAGFRVQGFPPVSR